jgi:hypothetical protein
MAIVKLITIKSWFRTGFRPTQAQFWDTWDSFWHKSDSIPMSSIEGLEDAFDLLEAPVTARVKPEKSETLIFNDGINTELDELLSGSYRIKKGMPVITGIIRNPLYWYGGKEVTIYNDTEKTVTLVHYKARNTVVPFWFPEFKEIILKPRQMVKLKFTQLGSPDEGKAQIVLELVSKNFELDVADVLLARTKIYPFGELQIFKIKGNINLEILEAGDWCIGFVEGQFINATYLGDDVNFLSSFDI